MSSMLEDLKDLIAFCEIPAPTFAGDTHAVGFRLLRPENPGDDVADEVVYDGLLFFKPSHTARFRLTGFGYALPVREFSIRSTPPLVKIGVPVGRHHGIETVLEFCNLDEKGGPGTVVRSIVCNAKVDDTFIPPSLEPANVTMLFELGTFRRRARLFPTTVLRNM